MSAEIIVCSRRSGTAIRAGMLVLSCLVAHSVAAGSFSVAPIRIELGPSHIVEALTIHNENDAPIILQARAVDWSQPGGTDRYADTRDVLVTPPVLSIPARGEQIVRVALRRESDPERELSYRLSIQEVPQAAPEGFKGLQVLLKVSLPVFVAPVSHDARSSLVWDAQWRDDGKLQIEAVNQGGLHRQVWDLALDFETRAASVPAGDSKYVLPGSGARWVVTPPPGVKRAAPIHVRGKSDQGDFTADVVWSTS
jgi:fimbrial chaperone protein